MNWSIELSSYKLITQYIKGTKNIMPECLSRLIIANVSAYDYEPNGLEY